jgi:hypothetical protein
MSKVLEKFDSFGKKHLNVARGILGQGEILKKMLVKAESPKLIVLGLKTLWLDGEGRRG